MAIVGSSEWSQHVAALLEAVDDLPLLRDAVLDAMDSLAPGSRGKSGFLIYTPSDEGQSVWIYPDSIKPPALDIVPWPHRDDPFISAALQGRGGCLPLREVVPPGFEASEYYERIYSKPGYCDEIVHVCRVDDLYILVGRMCSEHLSDQEIEEHRAAHPIISAAAKRVGEGFLRMGGIAHFEASPSVEQAIVQFGRDLLTPRERDVIQLILRGHNTESICHQLGISPNTVKRHRSHAYKKLRVGSHGELFSRFLESLGMRSTS